MDYFLSRNFFVEIKKNPATPLMHFVVLCLIFPGADPEPNLERGLYRQSELFIFVVFPYVPLLTTNIQTLSNFSLWHVTQNCTFSCYSAPYNNRNPCAEATVYLGFNILLQHRSMAIPPSTGCPGGNVSDFGRMFLNLKYTDITKNTYI